MHSAVSRRENSVSLTGGRLRSRFRRCAITAAPKDAGKYWAEITLGEEGNSATVHVVYDIAKADPAPTPAPASQPTPKPAPAVTSVTVNTKTVTAKTLNNAITKAGGKQDTVTSIVLGKKVKKISKGAFKSFKEAKTLVVKTKRLKKQRSGRLSRDQRSPK